MKQKSHSGTKKRVKAGGTKKKRTLRFQTSCANHLMTNKSKSSRRRSGQKVATSSAHKNRLKKLLPYAA